jgi:hypothetical protein
VDDNPYRPPRSDSSAEQLPFVAGDQEQSVSFELTEDDMIQFNLAHIKLYGGRRWRLGVLGVVFLLGAGVSGFSGSIGPWFIVALCLGSIFTYVGFWYGSRAHIVRMLHNAQAKGHTMGDPGAWTVTISADAICYDSPSKRVEGKWSIIERCVDTPDLVLLYTGPTTSLIIPARAFAAPGDQEQFVRLATSALTANRRSRGQPLLAAAPRRGTVWKVVILWLALVLAFFLVYQLVGGF